MKAVNGALSSTITKSAQLGKQAYDDKVPQEREYFIDDLLVRIHLTS